MPAAIEKIRIAEGNVLRAGHHLLANVREHNFTIHYPEHSLVNRHNRAMAAQMLASAARFGITGKAMLTGRKDDVRDRKSTRLNSSHGYISDAGFCLKKKKASRKHVR